VSCQNTIDDIINQMSGIKLDIGCGANKQPGGFVGMDRQALDGVEIVHDWNDMPWPLPDECVLVAVASHVVEHVNPADGGFLRWMDELWRVCKVDARVMISCPHGHSSGYLQDPTHCNQVSQATWAYFDPTHPSGFYRFYKPKPWKIERLNWSPVGNVEVVLMKILETEESEAMNA